MAHLGHDESDMRDGRKREEEIGGSPCAAVRPCRLRRPASLSAPTKGSDDRRGPRGRHKSDPPTSRRGLASRLRGQIGGRDVQETSPITSNFSRSPAKRETTATRRKNRRRLGVGKSPRVRTEMWPRKGRPQVTGSLAGRFAPTGGGVVCSTFGRVPYDIRHSICHHQRLRNHPAAI